MWRLALSILLSTQRWNVLSEWLKVLKKNVKICELFELLKISKWSNNISINSILTNRKHFESSGMVEVMMMPINIEVIPLWE